jgi:hypothetical protein
MGHLGAGAKESAARRRVAMAEKERTRREGLCMLPISEEMAWQLVWFLASTTPTRLLWLPPSLQSCWWLMI